MIISRRNVLTTAAAFALPVIASAKPSSETKYIPNSKYVPGINVLSLDQHLRSGRFYPTDVVRKTVETWKNKAIPGKIVTDSYSSEMDSPNRTLLSLDNASHIASNLRISNSILMCDIQILDSESGKKLAEMFRTSIIGFSMYCVCSLNSTGRVSKLDLIRVDVFVS